MEEVGNFEVTYKSEKSESFSSTNSYITLPKQTYRILGHWFVYVLAIIFLVGGFTFLALGIKDLVHGNDLNIHNYILFVVLVLISCVITYFFPFYASITIDMPNKIVIVKKYKLFFIIKKETKIDTNDIIRAYTEVHYLDKENNTDSDGFNLVFELKNGEKIIALEGENDRDYEMIKVSCFLKKFFPGLPETNNEENE